ncbi:tetraacyldisaccharide 4'-kinase [Sinisalibacter lacisalsi]|uniref:tetraacyldisaccharide 4'-kinase n=1 Tax=Sinisalibacter lacisalsi TaxID=1526570 RepID=UPI00166415A9|nr:tetraacyldisaccharide 4'-kinase [Sinisalibacter lacisalsi]
MAPRFWYRPPGALLRLIGPIAPGRTARRAAPRRLPVPVVAVGSLTPEGSGKTPMVIALAQRLAMKGRAVHVVTAGEGVPLRVDERRHSVAEVGDEPLLIAAFAPTWVAAEPGEGVRAAMSAGAQIVVLDGGVPEGPVAADLRILVENAARGFGNGYAWPLGPLKRRLGPGLAAADLLVTVGPDAAQTRFCEDWGGALPCPHLTARLEPLTTGMDWQGLDVVAFAGIGAPERFFTTLRGLGANLLRAQALTDHQELTPALMARLDAEARLRGAQLVTTEKDAVRLPRAFRQKVLSLPVRLELDDWAALDARLPGAY